MEANGHQSGDADASASECSEIMAEAELGKNGEQLALANYSQKVIEQKERELLESIQQNYSRLKGVEKELAQLQLQLKLSVGPKRQALELLRKKIEIQNGRVAAARAKYLSAKKVVDQLNEELSIEEAAKDQLCEELNMLVQQSATAQMNKLEDLRRQLEALNPAAHSDSDLASPRPSTGLDDALDTMSLRMPGSRPQSSASVSSARPTASPQPDPAKSPVRDASQQVTRQGSGPAPPSAKPHMSEEAAAARARHIKVRSVRPVAPSPTAPAVVPPVASSVARAKKPAFEGFDT